MKKYCLPILLISLLCVACEHTQPAPKRLDQDIENPDNPDQGNGGSTTLTKTMAGVSELGPFTKDSRIVIQELDADLAPKGKKYSTKVTNNQGEFNFGKKVFTQDVVLVTAEGYFYNISSGSYSSKRYKIESLASVKQNETVHINLFTHLEKKRVEYLVLKENKKFLTAKKQAVKEVFTSFGKTLTEDVISDDLNVSPKNKLALQMLSITNVVLNNKTEAQIAKFLNDFILDLEKDGQINSATLKSQIDTELKNLILLNSSGQPVQINKIKRYLSDIYPDMTVDTYESSFNGFAEEKANFEEFIKQANQFISELGSRQGINQTSKLYISQKATVPSDDFKFAVSKKHYGQRVGSVTGLQKPTNNTAPMFKALTKISSVNMEFTTTDNAQTYTSIYGFAYACNDFKFWQNGMSTCDKWQGGLDGISDPRLPAPKPGQPDTRPVVGVWNGVGMIFSEIVMVNERIEDPFSSNDKRTLKKGDEVQIAVNPFHNKSFSSDRIPTFTLNHTQAERDDSFVPHKNLAPRFFFKGGERIVVPIEIYNSRFRVKKEYAIFLGESPVFN